MAELNRAAGLQPPEFEAGRGEVTVRFWPTRIAGSTQSDRDLSPLQRELLAILAETGPAPLSQISERLRTLTPRRTIQDNLALLRRLALVESEGQRRGTRWALSNDR